MQVLQNQFTSPAVSFLQALAICCTCRSPIIAGQDAGPWLVGAKDASRFLAVLGMSVTTLDDHLKPCCSNTSITKQHIKAQHVLGMHEQLRVPSQCSSKAAAPACLAAHESGTLSLVYPVMQAHCRRSAEVFLCPAAQAVQGAAAAVRLRQCAAPMQSGLYSLLLPPPFLGLLSFSPLTGSSVLVARV